MNFDYLKNEIQKRIDENDIDFIIRLYQLCLIKHIYIPNEFEYKQYGRICVKNKYDIEKVKTIIKEMDDFEYDYIPDDLICTFDDYYEMVYIGKFDINLKELMKKLWNLNIESCYYLGRYNESYIEEL